MATAKATKAEITYTLELSEREAAALCELLLASNDNTNAGDCLNDIYTTLADAGAEKDGYHYEGRVTVYDETEDSQ